MPSPQPTASAVIVSGGKQYRVAKGDRILVQRLSAEAGSEVVIDRVLLHADGDEVKVGAPAIDGLTVTARVVGHPRGRKTVAFRYKSKKNVRVRRGGRADLTALEIVSIGPPDAAEKPAPKRTRAKKIDKKIDKKAEPKSEKTEAADGS